jgi:hypothetical protein
MLFVNHYNFEIFEWRKNCLTSADNYLGFSRFYALIIFVEFSLGKFTVNNRNIFFFKKIFIPIKEGILNTKLIELDSSLELDEQRISLSTSYIPYADRRTKNKKKIVKKIYKFAFQVMAKKIPCNEHFLKWLLDEHFIFLGYRKYSLDHKGSAPTIKADKGSGLGILRDDSASSLVEAKELKEISKNLQRYMSSPDALTLTKAITKSTVHRYADMDYIGVKEFDAKGRVIAEHRFLGLLPQKHTPLPCGIFHWSAKKLKTSSGKNLSEGRLAITTAP